MALFAVSVSLHADIRVFSQASLAENGEVRIFFEGAVEVVGHPEAALVLGVHLEANCCCSSSSNRPSGAAPGAPERGKDKRNALLQQIQVAEASAARTSPETASAAKFNTAQARRSPRPSQPRKRTISKQFANEMRNIKPNCRQFAAVSSLSAQPPRGALLRGACSEAERRRELTLRKART